MNSRGHQGLWRQPCWASSMGLLGSRWHRALALLLASAKEPEHAGCLGLGREGRAMSPTYLAPPYSLGADFVRGLYGRRRMADRRASRGELGTTRGSRDQGRA